MGMAWTEKKRKREQFDSGVVSIGAHTVSHPSLANLNRRDQEIEINSSIKRLEQIIQKKITLFSYPFGVPKTDFNEDTIEICRKCGIVKAASTEFALWNASSDPYRIPRKIVRDWGVREFERKIQDYWED